MLRKLFARPVCLFVAVLLLSTSFLQAAHSQHPRFDTIRDRIETRNYPSVFGAWGQFGFPAVVDRTDLSPHQQMALYDVHWGSWGIYYLPSDNGAIAVGDNINLINGLNRQRWTLHNNPNAVFLAAFLMHALLPSYLSPDSIYWIRDDNGAPIVLDQEGYLLCDFTHPGMQQIIIGQAVMAAESGLYDGVFFDWWTEDYPILHGYRTLDEEVSARVNILRGIRDKVHPDFLIVVNANNRMIPQSAPYVNGVFMETFSDMGIGYSLPSLAHLERALLWHVENLRTPRLICLEGNTQALPLLQLRSPEVQQWMRLFTTMSLTHTDGSVLYSFAPGHEHVWYDFWDADLGQPVGPKMQHYLVDGSRYAGLYLREFTNGWALYNRSGVSANIELPDVTVAISTGKYDYIHTVPSMDGEIFLKSHATRVHPRGSLTTSWAKIKAQ